MELAFKMGKVLDGYVGGGVGLEGGLEMSDAGF